MARFSVIVPVYKVEGFLEKCVDSVLDQSFSDFELILVDDGSPDRCGEICDRYARQDSRVVVIHRENGGVSAARNQGIEAATGDYVAFVDADDFVSPDFLSCAQAALLQQPEADIVQFGWRSFSEGEAVAVCENASGKLCAHSTQEAMADFLRFRTFTHTPWGKVIRRGLLQGISFPLDIKVGEDLHVSYRLLGKASSIISTDSVAYYYCIRSGSAMSSRGPSSVADALWVFTRMHEYYRENFPALNTEAARRYVNDLLQLLRDLEPMKNTDEKRRVTKAVKDSLTGQPDGLLPAKTVMFKHLALRCPPLYFLIYKLKK